MLRLMMEFSLLRTGFLFFIMVRYMCCLESYWEELSSLRNYLPNSDSEFKISIASSLFACVSHCLMTDSCCFISYTATTSECVRHRKWKGYKFGISSSFWIPLTEDGCPCGWSRFKTSCFLIPDVQLSWRESKEYCQKLDAKLAELDTEAKDIFVVDLIKKSTVERTWIGGSDIDEEGIWTWSTSGVLLQNTYQNWGQRQPDNQPVDSDCLCISIKYKFIWDDNACSDIGALVCEKTVRETDHDPTTSSASGSLINPSTI